MGLILPTAGSEHKEHQGAGTIGVRGGFPLSPMRHDRPLTIGDKASKHEMAATATCFAGGADDAPSVIGGEKGVMKTTKIMVVVEDKKEYGENGLFADSITGRVCW
jgi:hypothetical protein